MFGFQTEIFCSQKELVSSGGFFQAFKVRHQIVIVHPNLILRDLVGLGSQFKIILSCHIGVKLRQIANVGDVLRTRT